MPWWPGALRAAALSAQVSTVGDIWVTTMSAPAGAAAPPAASPRPALRCVPFQQVVDSRSSHFSVPAGVVERVKKPIKTFFKVFGLVVDETRTRMWFEVIGSQAEMDALHKKLAPGQMFLFGSICFKQSPYHSGSKFLDLQEAEGLREPAASNTSFTRGAAESFEARSCDFGQHRGLAGARPRQQGGHHRKDLLYHPPHPEGDTGNLPCTDRSLLVVSCLR